MAHCPQCGTANVPGATSCKLCGAALHLAPAPGSPGANPAATARGSAPSDPLVRTVVGVSAVAAIPQPTPTSAAPGGGTQRMEAVPEGGAPRMVPPTSGRTIVGLPVTTVGAGTPIAFQHAAPPVGPPQPDPFAQAHAASRPPEMPAAVSRTIVGGLEAPIGGRDQPPPWAGSVPVQRTMQGVAIPGIAPLQPGVAPPEEPPPFDSPSYRPASELGATVVVSSGQAHAPRAVAVPKRYRAEAQVKVPRPAPKTSGRVIALLATAGVLVVGAILFAILLPRTPPLSASPRIDSAGREVLAIECSSCPDGTKLTLGDGTASIMGHAAELPMSTPLPVGESVVPIAIDRPGRGRDETVSVPVRIAYRIRPDLQTLQGDRPAIQIVIEAVGGTTIARDGKPVPLMNGHAIETIDVTDAVTGVSDDQSTLARQVPYVITPPKGAPEQRTVTVSIGILPLHIDAPGPMAVIDGKNFVLAGRTMKGAEVIAAGRPIPVKPDGTFVQVMNVNAIGATQIEVRAKLAGAAPRIAHIGVRRVDSLETAAREFMQQRPLTYAALAPDIAGSVSKPVVVAGEVIESRRQNHQTIMLLDIAAAHGCSGSGPCRVRLVQGADNPAQHGDLLTAYGHVTRAFASEGNPEIPEIQVDFTLKGLR